MSEDGKKKEDVVKTKIDNAKVRLKSPNVCTFNTINNMNIEWRLQKKKSEKEIGYAKLYMKPVQ